MRPEGAYAVPAVELRSFIRYSTPTDNSFFIITRSVRSIYTFNTKCLSAAQQSDLCSTARERSSLGAAQRDLVPSIFPYFLDANELKNYVLLAILLLF